MKEKKNRTAIEHQPFFWKRLYCGMAISLFVNTLFLLYSCSDADQKTKIVEYNTVSFLLRGKWNVETKTDASHTLFYIGCEKNDDTADAFVVRFTTQTVEPERFLNDHLAHLRAQTKLTTEKIERGRFGIYDCVFINYAFSMAISDYYGTAYAFQNADKTILILKQSSSTRRLKNKFNEIESTFRVDAPAA